MKNDTDYIRVLNDNGIRPSVQRIAIYKYVAEHTNHPTVDTVYRELNPLYPTLSRTTVYSTLHTLAQSNLILSVRIEDDEIRYDGNTNPHIHFKCKNCGEIFDIFPEQISTIYDSYKSIIPEGFKAEYEEINIWGICPECEKKSRT